jgi:signal transduction histidine kinase
VDLSNQLHAISGLCAVVLGIGVLARAPTRRRNRLFAALCAALALWNLGMVARASGVAPEFPWHLVYLLGGCATAPVALHFAVAVSALPARSARWLLTVGDVAAAVLWVSAWLFHGTRSWSLAALVVLGSLLGTSLAILGRQVSSLPPGRERGTLGRVLVAGVLAVAGGLSDFVPRTVESWPRVGPVFVMLFLLIVSAVVVRHRFLDVDVYLARAAALIIAASGVALVLLFVTRTFGARFVPLLLASLAVLAAAGPLARAWFERTRGLLGGDDEAVADVLVATSRRLEAAREAGQVWEAIDEGGQALPRGVRLAILLRGPGDGPFRITYPKPPSATTPEMAANDAVPTLLERERSPLTRRLLEIGSREDSEHRRRLARHGLEAMRSLDSEILVPLFGADRLIGCLSLGGGDPESYVRADVAAALVAVGQQAVASLDRMRIMEEAKRHEALAAVGEMAAGLAHEVRNPVAAIRGAAQAITPDASPDQAREMLGVIREETARLERVVGEFLDYARPASPRREPVDLADAARRVARDAGLAGLDVRIDLDVEPETPPAAGDPDQIRRVFENLVRNAAQATGPGGTLRIRIASSGGRVTARFEDDGPGIPDDRLASLFQPFQTTRVGGTGLGLALVHRIVEAHAGEIEVDGRPGIGAVFTLTFPAFPRRTGGSGRMGP